MRKVIFSNFCMSLLVDLELHETYENEYLL